MHVLWNISFVNMTQLPLQCEKTGDLAKVEPGVTAGWQADQNAVKEETLNSVYLTFKMCIRHLDQIFSIDKVVPVHVWPVF